MKKKLYNSISPEVEAEKLTKTTTWTPYRSKTLLTNTKGDWKLNQQKNKTDWWCVSNEDFAATYQKQTNGNYKKIAQVWLTKINKTQKVKTKEGPTTGHKGDYIAEHTNRPGKWIITKKQKQEKYKLAKQKHQK